jgi:ankyrin repeat protein
MMHLRLDTIRFFVSEWPDALLQPSNDGQLPLHCAARAGTLETVRFLVQQSPGSVRVATTTDGCVPLHCAADADDARVCDDDEDWPEERRSVLRYLFRQWPEAVRLPCRQGFLPLHYAAKRMCSVPTLKFLVDQHPESVSAPSADGSLPVHLAVARDIPKLRIVRFLARSMPTSLMVPTNDGLLPLHVALAQNEPSRKIVRFLVEQSPGALLVANATGSLPLHLALSKATCWPTLVKLLVEQHPETLQVPDGQGFLPFQIAAANDAPLDVVFYLVAKWPGGVAGATSRKTRAPSATKRKRELFA